MKLPTAIFASIYMIGLFTLVGCLVIFNSHWWGLLLVAGVMPSVDKEKE